MPQKNITAFEQSFLGLKLNTLLKELNKVEFSEAAPAGKSFWGVDARNALQEIYDFILTLLKFDANNVLIAPSVENMKEALRLQRYFFSLFLKEGQFPKKSDKVVSAVPPELAKPSQLCLKLFVNFFKDIQAMAENQNESVTQKLFADFLPWASLFDGFKEVKGVTRKFRIRSGFDADQYRFVLAENTKIMPTTYFSVRSEALVWHVESLLTAISVKHPALMDSKDEALAGTAPTDVVVAAEEWEQQKAIEDYAVRMETRAKFLALKKEAQGLQAQIQEKRQALLTKCLDSKLQSCDSQVVKRKIQEFEELQRQTALQYKQKTMLNALASLDAQQESYKNTLKEVEQKLKNLDSTQQRCEKELMVVLEKSAVRNSDLLQNIKPQVAELLVLHCTEREVALKLVEAEIINLGQENAELPEEIEELTQCVKELDGFILEKTNRKEDCSAEQNVYETKKEVLQALTVRMNESEHNLKLLMDRRTTLLAAIEEDKKEAKLKASKSLPTAQDVFASATPVTEGFNQQVSALPPDATTTLATENGGASNKEPPVVDQTAPASPITGATAPMEPESVPETQKGKEEVLKKTLEEIDLAKIPSTPFAVDLLKNVDTVYPDASNVLDTAQLAPFEKLHAVITTELASKAAKEDMQLQDLLSHLQNDVGHHSKNPKCLEAVMAMRIAVAKPTIQQRKTWQIALANIAVACTGVGLFILAAMLIHAAVTKQDLSKALFFSRTDSQRALEKVEGALGVAVAAP